MQHGAPGPRGILTSQARSCQLKRRPTGATVGFLHFDHSTNSELHSNYGLLKVANTCIPLSDEGGSLVHVSVVCTLGWIAPAGRP